jgi:adenosine 3'-phospho 5'-phosphosulfate transporter B2
VLKRIVVGREADGVLPSVTTTIPSIAVSQSTSSRAFMLMFCAGGLLFCHMLWGIFQERIMAFEYTENGKTERFRNSQFLVFMNRLFSLVVAGVVLLFSKQARSEAPMYLYGYASLSNILSSWFQYESLKYIIFPLMTLGKSCKVIAVMLMGKCVSKKTYETYEYASAFLISFGIFVFFMNTQEDKKHHQQTLLLSGLFLLIGYLACDSFTSNWQDKIFKEHKVKPLQMMFGVNLCSVLLTSVSLVQQGAYSDTMAFTLRHPTFFSDVLCLSLSSALGQLFIYKTINEFGPVIFTIIMTTRQALAVLFSCFYFNHPINLAGFVGIFIAFGAIFGQIYFKQRTKKQPATKQASKPTS